MMADSGDHVEGHAEAFDGENNERPKVEVSRPERHGITNDEAHLDPSRWWFASSAFPMIAGTLGPVASAFSICALVRPWRQHFPPGSDIDKAQFINDPIWCVIPRCHIGGRLAGRAEELTIFTRLTVINAIQLATALVANLILLLNMAKKIKFTIAQPITIVTWYVIYFSPSSI